jgi:hypothetical protein
MKLTQYDSRRGTIPADTVTNRLLQKGSRL